MSNKPIGPNDLVVCVGGCGCWVGAIFTVSRLEFLMSPMRSLCEHCGWTDSYISIARSTDNSFTMSVNWLKRIDPPPLEEETKRGEELMA